jgi:hypothetical protein
MGPPNLLMICISAFSTVFVLLALLALVMKLLINVFPEKVKDQLDAAMLAAVSASLSVVYPQTKITKVEQVR